MLLSHHAAHRPEYQSHATCCCHYLMMLAFTLLPTCCYCYINAVFAAIPR